MPNQYLTAGTIISRAAVQLGLGAAPDPYASTDPAFQQLCEFLSTVGDDLARAHAWPQLRRECLISTLEGQTAYPLPADFGGPADQSEWNRTTRFPLVGPLSPQQWQAAKASVVSGIQTFFRFTPTEIELLTSPAEGTTLAFDYKSTFWVQDGTASSNVDAAGSPLGTKAAPTQASDLVLLDGLLLVKALKLAFLTAKSFDTVAAQTDYETRLSLALGSAGAAPTLSLSARRPRFGRLLDSTSNVSDSGYGR